MAIDKCNKSESILKIPLKQQEYFSEFLKECELNLKNLKENLNLYEKFNLNLYLNESNLNKFKFYENQFYDFYQNL